MKRMLIVLGLLGVLVGCTSTVAETKGNNVVAKQDVTAKKDHVNFKRNDNNQIITLESSDLYETGILIIGERKIKMHRAISGSGIRMVGEVGNAEVHFKRDEGILSLDGKEIDITVVK